MTRLKDSLQTLLAPIAAELGIPAPLRLEFSRRGTSLFSCGAFLTAGASAPSLAQKAARLFNDRHADWARADASGGFVNFSPTAGALHREMEHLARICPDTEPDWSDADSAAAVHRLRANRAFGKSVPFDAAAAYAILRAEQHLPYDAAILAAPLDPLLSRAWESLLLRERKKP